MQGMIGASSPTGWCRSPWARHQALMPYRPFAANRDLALAVEATSGRLLPLVAWPTSWTTRYATNRRGRPTRGALIARLRSLLRGPTRMGGDLVPRHPMGASNTRPGRDHTQLPRAGPRRGGAHGGGQGEQGGSAVAREKAGPGRRPRRSRQQPRVCASGSGSTRRTSHICARAPSCPRPGPGRVNRSPAELPEAQRPGEDQSLRDEGRTRCRRHERPRRGPSPSSRGPAELRRPAARARTK